MDLAEQIKQLYKVNSDLLSVNLELTASKTKLLRQLEEYKKLIVAKDALIEQQHEQGDEVLRQLREISKDLEAFKTGHQQQLWWKS